MCLFSNSILTFSPFALPYLSALPLFSIYSHPPGTTSAVGVVGSAVGVDLSAPFDPTTSAFTKGNRSAFEVAEQMRNAQQQQQQQQQ